MVKIHVIFALDNAQNSSVYIFLLVLFTFEFDKQRNFEHYQVLHSTIYCQENSKNIKFL